MCGDANLYGESYIGEDAFIEKNESVLDFQYIFDGKYFVTAYKAKEGYRIGGYTFEEFLSLIHTDKEFDNIRDKKEFHLLIEMIRTRFEKDYY